MNFENNLNMNVGQKLNKILKDKLSEYESVCTNFKKFFNSEDLET